MLYLIHYIIACYLPVLLFYYCRMQIERGNIAEDTVTNLPHLHNDMMPPHLVSIHPRYEGNIHEIRHHKRTLSASHRANMLECEIVMKFTITNAPYQHHIGRTCETVK